MAIPKSKDQFEQARGAQQSGVRLANERTMMTLIALNPGISGAELARLSGLGPQTVSRIVSELEAAGFVGRGEVRRGKRGQPATPLFLEPNSAFAIGCEIGWRHAMVQLINLDGQVLGHHRWDYPFPDARTVLESAASVIKLMVDVLPESRRSRLLGVGLASPSGIERNVDLLGAGPADVKAWVGVDIGTRMSQLTGLPIRSYNDGNAACWGEFGVQPKPRPANFVYFLVGTFIGAGIISQSTLWEGPTGNSANIGSMLVSDKRGQQNFVHLISSISALETRLFARGLVMPPGSPEHWDWSALGPELDDWLDDAARAVATAIINTAAVIEFNRAVVDGVMPRSIVERLVERVRFHIGELPILTADRPDVGMGHLGAAAPSRGAAQLLLYRRFFARDREFLVA